MNLMTTGRRSTASSNELVSAMVNIDSDKDPDVFTTDLSGSGNREKMEVYDLETIILVKKFIVLLQKKDKSISYKNLSCSFGFFSICGILVDHDKSILKDTQVIITDVSCTITNKNNSCSCCFVITDIFVTNGFSLVKI